MTAIHILETLAHEFSVQPGEAQAALEMMDAGLCAPFVGRFRRTQVGMLPESVLRRMERRRIELEELDRRRATILSVMEREGAAPPAALEAVRRCMDRFELEDLFIPHRRPEPEVQLAIDRGLGELAELLVAPVPEAERTRGEMTPESSGAEETETVQADGAAPAGGAAEARPDPSSDTAAPEVHDAVGEEVPAHNPADSMEDEAHEEPAAVPSPRHAIDVKTAMNVHLARLCAPFVRPDKGIHTDTEALSGALRILSDHLGRSARLRGMVRRLLAKQGVLSVRPTTSDHGRLGRHRALLRLRQPLRQIQGHRLLAIRQAQKERLLNTIITLDPRLALPKVRSELGRHTHPAHETLLDELALQALDQRLIPMLEPDVRLELKDRADAEALRFLSQHLRQVLLSPPAGPVPVAGIDVSAKGDWIVAPIDREGRPIGPEARIEAGEKDAEALGAELRAALGESGARALAIGHGKGARAALPRIRAAARTDGLDLPVLIVNESGISSYASSEIARAELPDRTVPVRMAISLGRRLQDPMAEILKVDPRHLGLGSEQGLVSKANARRVFDEAIESCVAMVGCDVNRAPESLLSHIPGLDRAAARRIVERRRERPFTSREDLRTDELLTEPQWMGAVAFLRVPGSTEPLDATGLHPEQYPLVRRLLDSAGTSLEQALGRFHVVRNLRPDGAEVDEATWRDIQRELSAPGRDPRHELYPPTLLDPGTEPARLVRDRVVEGVVSNVASFGVFVDVGLAQDALVHISEISDRYVRDAREHVSIGQVVRARILETQGQRLTLSLRKVPWPVREREAGDRPPPRGRRGRGARGEGGEGGPRDGQDRGGERRGRPDRHAERELHPNLRAAQRRRDGLVVGSGRSRGGTGGPGGRRGGPPSEGGRGPRGRRDTRGGGDGDYGPADLREVNERPGKAFKPFASFFKDREKDEDETGDAQGSGTR